MPQFDFYSFSSQTFWLLSIFFIFYFFILYFYLANFSEVLKMRKKIFALYSSTSGVNKNMLNFYNLFMHGIFLFFNRVYSLMVKHTAHNGNNVGSTPARLNCLLVMLCI